MDRIFRRLFKQHFGAPPVSVLEIAGDGSARKMVRLVGPNMETAVGVVGPDPDENRAFLAFTRAFRSIDLPVPEVYAVDRKAGVYIEEDLGETTLFDAVGQARQADPDADFPAAMLPIYRRILEVLPRFQVEGGQAVDYSVAYPRAAFDRQSILWDLNYFKYHFLKLAHIPFNEARLEKDFRRFATFLLGADTRHFLYRDFQSRNVMVRDGEPWFIDYQGGRRGALQYDVASLLYDPKVGLTEPLREELLEHYLGELEKRMPVDRDRFRQHLRGYTLVRILQAMGAYGYRGFFERKPRFLQSVPQAIRNVERLLETGFVPVELPEFRAVLETICGSTTLRKRQPAPKPGLTVYTGSFSYKRGYPDDAGGHGGGFVFDCRAVHNPGRYSEYASLCGCDEPVKDFLESLPEVEDFWLHVRGLAEHHVGAWLTRGFSSLSVNFGCTGGQHRSVYFAERLAAYLRANYPSVHVVLTHREQDHWPDRDLAMAQMAGATAGATEPA
ncbi:MAG TPA: RNase adapter RapZ [Longimicrobium sp.]|uniref:RapZ C-terminal domain-containing protein n=1 Tax=Longimicrobium sp. TaxID=2029185 RepID=UPI002EDAE9CF